MKHWRKLLFLLWLALSVAWSVSILSTNYGDFSAKRIIPPDNATILRAIHSLANDIPVDNGATPGDNTFHDGNPVAGKEDIITMSYEPMSTSIELRGFDGSDLSQAGASRSIRLPLTYRTKSAPDTLREILRTFEQSERERRSYLVNRIIVHITWPILLSAVVFYMIAWALYRRMESSDSAGT